MRELLKRDEFLSRYNHKDSSLNEALANDINWGDSLVGRLINSILRKAQIGVNLVKIDRVIERLKAEFDSLVELIKVNDNTNLFYIIVSALLGQLIVEIEKSKDIKEIINITKSTISGVSAVNAPDDKTSVDKKEVLEKLNQFLTELESMDGGSQEEDSDDESDDSAEEKPLALGAGEKLPSINLDVMKLNPAQALKYLPEYQKAVEFSQKSLATVKSGLLRTEVTQGVNVSDEESSEFKKKYRECAIFYHPDKITVSGLTKEEADELFKKVKECYTKKDFKTLQKMYDNISKIKSAKETLDKFNKIKSDLEKKSKETPENEPDPNNPNKKAIGSGEVKKTEAPVEKNERRVSSYIGFVLEKQDDDLLKGEDSEISKKVKVVFDKIFTEEFMVKYQVKEQDASKFKDDGNREITIDPILEIVKIFNRAYKIHTPGNIPSGRKGGKISNRVFREYEYVGEGNDDARNAEDGGISPGIGPYRNRAVFNKWENAVLDIIKNPKYQEIFNEKTIFKFGKADARANKVGTKEGGGKVLLKFMNDMLDGSSLYRKGAQREFISQYFGVTIDDKKLGFTYKDVEDNIKVSSKVVDDNYEFKEYKVGSLKNENAVGSILRGVSVEGNNTWVFRILKVDKKNTYFVMSNGFPFALKVKDITKYLSAEGNIYVGSAVWGDFEKGTINKKRLLVPDRGNIEDWQANEEFTSKLKNIEILYKGDKIFKANVKGKESEQRNKFKNIKENGANLISKLS